jgi:hypothetical protein
VEAGVTDLAAIVRRDDAFAERITADETFTEAEATDAADRRNLLVLLRETRDALGPLLHVRHDATHNGSIMRGGDWGDCTLCGPVQELLSELAALDEPSA